jgi:hypothetical protein
MGYRDPKIRQAQRRFRGVQDKCEQEALRRYGITYYDLPEVLRYALYAEVCWGEDPLRRGANRRFRSHVDRRFGWRNERAYDAKRTEAERLSTVEVRKKRSKRKPHARRFNGRRPEAPPDMES